MVQGGMVSDHTDTENVDSNTIHLYPHTSELTVNQNRPKTTMTFEDFLGCKEQIEI
jgi:hypothetical protein